MWKQKLMNSTNEATSLVILVTEKLEILHVSVVEQLQK